MAGKQMVTDRMRNGVSGSSGSEGFPVAFGEIND